MECLPLLLEQYKEIEPFLSAVAVAYFSYEEQRPHAAAHVSAVFVTHVVRNTRL